MEIVTCSIEEARRWMHDRYSRVSKTGLVIVWEYPEDARGPGARERAVWIGQLDRSSIREL